MPKFLEVDFNDLSNYPELLEQMNNGSYLFIDGKEFKRAAKAADDAYTGKQYGEYIKNRVKEADRDIKHYSPEDVLATAIAMGRRVVYYPVDQKTGLVSKEPVVITKQKELAVDEAWTDKSKKMSLNTGDLSNFENRYRTTEEEYIKDVVRIENVKNTSQYKRVEGIYEGIKSIMLPLREAAFPGREDPQGHGKFNLYGAPVTEQEAGKEDYKRWGISSVIACLISEGHKIDDILDPAKLVEEKRLAAERMLRLSREGNYKELMQIYIVATETIDEYLPDEVNEDIFKNMDNPKHVILRRLLFEMSQSFGKHMGEFREVIDEKFQKNGNENWKEDGDKYFNQIYDIVLHHQDLSGFEDKMQEILKLDESKARLYITYNILWDRKKDIIINLKNKKDITNEEIDDLRKELFGEVEALNTEIVDSNANCFDVIIQQDGYKGVLLEAFGTEYTDSEFSNPSARIFIEGQSLSGLMSFVNLYPDNYIDILDGYIKEAIAAGKRVVIYPQDDRTFTTDPNPIVIQPIPEAFAPEDALKTLPVSKVRSVQSVSAEQAAEMEKNQIEIIKGIEKIYQTPAYQTLINARYASNSKSAVIAESIYGKEGVKNYKADETIGLVATAIPTKGAFSFSRSGLALAVAALLADGMSLDDILDPEKFADEKIAKGKQILQWAEEGVEGKHKMALAAAEGMKKLHEGKYLNFTTDLHQLNADFKTTLVCQCMFDLNQETASQLDLLGAYKEDFRKNHPAYTEKQIEIMANKAYNEVQNYVGPYEIVRRFYRAGDEIAIQKDKANVDLWASKFLAYAHESFNNHDYYFGNNIYELNGAEDRVAFALEHTAYNHDQFQRMAKVINKDVNTILLEGNLLNDMDSNVSMQYQHYILQTLLNDIEEAEKNVHFGSKEFKGMKLAVQDILKHYEKGFDAVTPEWHNELEKKYQALSFFNDAYLDMKKGRDIEEGSKTAKRIEVANRIKAFSEEAFGLVEQRNDLFIRNVNEGLQRIQSGVPKKLDTFDKMFEVIFAPKKVNKIQVQDENAIDLTNRINVIRKEENEITELAGFTEKEVALLTLVGSATYDAGKQYMGQKIAGKNETYQTEKEIRDFVTSRTGGVIEDIFNIRVGVDDAHMPSIEEGRKNVKEALIQYKEGNAKPLGAILAEGLTNIKGIFASSKSGFGIPMEAGKMIAPLRKAVELYDMVTSHEDLLKAATDPSLGDKALSRETLENFRAAKSTLTVLENGVEARNNLLKLNNQKINTPENQKMIKQALADLVLKNMVDNAIRQSNAKQEKNIDLEAIYANARNTVLGTYASLAESFRFNMSEQQLKLTPKKIEKYREKLLNSKIIDKMAKNMNSRKISQILNNEKDVLDAVTSRIKESEAAVFKDKDVKLDKTINNVQNKEVEVLKGI